MAELIEIIKLGPGGVIAALLIGTLYFVLVRHTRALDNLSARQDRMAERFDEAMDIHAAVLVSLQAQLLAHDLTVSGLNPTAGATFPERDSKALAKYTEVQRLFEKAHILINARHARSLSMSPHGPIP